MKGHGKRRRRSRIRTEILEIIAAQEAYRNAWYAILPERVEEYLRDPQRVERVHRSFRDCFKELLEEPS